MHAAARPEPNAARSCSSGSTAGPTGIQVVRYGVLKVGAPIDGSRTTGVGSRVVRRGRPCAARAGHQPTPPLCLHVVNCQVEATIREPFGLFLEGTAELGSGLFGLGAAQASSHPRGSESEQDEEHVGRMPSPGVGALRRTV